MRALVLALAILLIAPVGAQALLGNPLSEPEEATVPPGAETQMSADAAPAPAATQPTSTEMVASGADDTAQVTPQEMFAQAVDAMGPAAQESEAVRNLALLMQQAPGNATNDTVLQTENGTHTHRHGAVGGNGLAQVWATPFHGTASKVVVADLDGDGKDDAVVASDLSVTALAADGRMLWARHLGSTVTGIAVTDLGLDNRLDVVFSTLWEGQSARVEAVAAASGHPSWSYVGEQSFIGLTPTETGDVLTVDTDGNHIRLDGLTGKEVWKTPVDPLPDVGALVAGHYNIGHYLFESADINGDGTMDSISVGMYEYFAFGVQVYMFNVYNIVHAVDGATGEEIWLHEVGLEPNPDGYRFTFLTALTDLDYNGDGGGDVGYAGYTLWWFTSASIAGLWFEEFVRVIDGSTPTVAAAVSSKELLAPLLMLEVVTDMDHVDTDGDGNDEIALLRQSLVDALLNGYAMQYERYEVMADAGANPAMVALSDQVVAVNHTARMSAGTGDIAHYVMFGDNAFGYIVAVGLDGTPRWEATLPSGPARTAAPLGDGFVVGTKAAVEFRDASHDMISSFPMRGAPISFSIADYDGDGFDDAWVASTDGNVHIIDGLTGRIVKVIDLAGAIIAIEPVDMGHGLDWRIVRMAGGESNMGYVELWDSDNGTRIWSHEIGYVYGDYEPVWFDANNDGIDDLFGSWNGFDMHATIIDGKDGSILADNDIEIEETSYLWADDVWVMRRDDGPDRVVVADGSYGMLAINGDGSKAWYRDFDEYSWRMCGAGADLDGDGTDELITFRDENPPVGQIISWDGKAEKIKGLPDMYWLNSCSVDRIALEDHDEALIGLTYYVSGDGYHTGFARYGVDGWGWKDFQKDTFNEIGGIVPLGVDAGGDGGRFFYGNEDHVHIARWDTAEELGQFTLDGPFVTEGVVLDLDGSDPAEVLALGADGMLWALATDAEAVQKVLVEEAKKQGKTTDIDVEEILDTPIDKKSPGLELPLLAVGIAALALARRRR